jgi:hypothetical protein
LWPFLFAAGNRWDTGLHFGTIQATSYLALFAARILWDGRCVHCAVNGIFSTTKISIVETLLQVTCLGALGAGTGLVFWLIARPDKSAALGAQISN